MYSLLEQLAITIMKNAPFNSCDYRCERCLETNRCRVFQTMQKRSLLDTVQNGGDLDAVLQDLRESFRETEELIKEKARELGIDIDEIAGGASPEEIRENHAAIADDELYRKCRSFMTDTSRFLKQLVTDVKHSGGEYVDDISWHHTVVTAKIYRALGWKTCGEIAEDAKNSAAVAMKSLTICIMAFDELGSRHPAVAEASARLSAGSRQLKDEIRKRFWPEG